MKHLIVYHELSHLLLYHHFKLLFQAVASIVLEQQMQKEWSEVMRGCDHPSHVFCLTKQFHINDIILIITPHQCNYSANVYKSWAALQLGM